MAAIAVLLAVIGCSSSSDSTPTLSSAEASSVAAAIFQDLSAALATATFSAPPAAPSALIQPTQSGSSSVSGSCPSGGTISGSVNYNLTYADDGLSGNTNETVTFGFHNCVVSTGERNLTVNGNLNTTASSTYSYSGSQLNDQFSYQLSGTIDWSEGSCQINYTVSGGVSGSGESYRITGNICGQSVNASY
jgi:hypothetical protein